jgi:hypothetical protein
MKGYKWIMKVKYTKILYNKILGWYSVTPEDLAKYTAIAVTGKNSIVVDAFCGSGGNVIQVINSIS